MVRDINYDFTRQDVDAINSFLLLATYNGHENDVRDIITALYKAFKIDADEIYKSVRRPDWRDKTDEFGGIFWSWLVLQYGDYGTSPRFGWIYAENARKLYTIMSELIESKDDLYES